MCREREADPGSDPAEVRVPGGAGPRRCRQPRARHSRPRPRPPAPGARPPPTPVPAPRTDLSPARLPGPHPLPARPPPALPAPPGARQSRSRGDSPAAAAPVPASPPHPGAGGASGSSQSKSRALRSAQVRRGCGPGLRRRHPRKRPASAGSSVPRPRPGSPFCRRQPRPSPEPLFQGLRFRQGRGEVKTQSDFRLGRLQTQDPPLLVQWEENQVPETACARQPAAPTRFQTCGGKNSGAERAPRRQLGPPLEVCAGAARARGNRAVFARGPADLAGAVDHGCQAGRDGRSSEESPWSGRSGAVAARAPEDLLPTVAVSAVDAAAFPPTAAERAVGVWLPAAWP